MIHTTTKLRYSLFSYKVYSKVPDIVATIADYFDEDIHYCEDMDQLNNRVNFALLGISDAYNITKESVFNLMMADCEIVDELGITFPIEGNIDCGKMRGKVNY